MRPTFSTFGESRYVGGHLRAEAALRVEEDQQHVFAAKLRQAASLSLKIGKLEVRCECADRQSFPSTGLSGGRRSMPNVFINRLELQQNAAVLADELGFDRARLLRWGLAQAVLAAWWCIEDHGGGWQQFARCAELIDEAMA